jgi:membrane protease YdiL (CAAX protease family)
VFNRRSARTIAFATLAAGALLAIRPMASALGRWGDTLGFELFLGLIALAFAAHSRVGIRQRLGLSPSALSQSAQLALVLGVLALSFSLDGVYRLVESRESGALFEFESELAGARGVALAMSLLVYALVPGIAEELLCRGLVQRGLQRLYGPIPAIALASLFFGALHLDPVHSAFAAVIGLYLGATAHLSKSIRTSIACHIANNTAAVLGAAFAPNLGPMPTLLLVAAAVLSLSVLAWIACHHKAATPSLYPQKEGPRGLQKRCGSDDS